MTLIQMRALLEGLDVPNTEWWLMQPPESFFALGKVISDQAKQVTRGDGIENLGAQIRVMAERSNAEVKGDTP